MMTLQFPQFPRRFLTGSFIAFSHAVVFGLIILNPVKHFQATPKDTVVMMLPSALPEPATPIKKVEKAAPPASAIIPVINQVAVQQIIDEAITATPSATEISAPSLPTPAPQSTMVAKSEPAGPKVVSAVEYIHAPQADYPPMARRMGEEGRVVMQVLVNDKGRAEKVEIVKSSGFARLDESAKMALFRALFKPYLEDGKATMVLATASINFSLRG